MRIEWAISQHYDIRMYPKGDLFIGKMIFWSTDFCEMGYPIFRQTFNMVHSFMPQTFGRCKNTVKPLANLRWDVALDQDLGSDWEIDVILGGIQFDPSPNGVYAFIESSGSCQFYSQMARFQPQKIIHSLYQLDSGYAAHYHTIWYHRCLWKGGITIQMDPNGSLGKSSTRSQDMKKSVC